MERKILAYGKHYETFMKTLSDKERNKIRKALLLFSREDKIPHHYIKYIRDSVFEFRVNFSNNEFRIFFIYDGKDIIVLFNGFKKKTKITPQNEIEKAIRLKNEYKKEKYGTI
ncbi:MAG: Uncharacterized protein XD92_0584 [Proteiniphilum acetatigenes]|jgi:phage-related protein|uniref:Toxin-antitoxin system, toxin component, RelE family n=1 Tax=Proteiniphilum acetatigenes TaxID=294710 RepID=A0A101HJK3_9BACT|nr:MAG: Uncharacterized protein XD92_0584 [Proteiniphilum acetatigenes]KUL19754.1 MAG: Uncharacterized protein XE13_0448 [Proteiniphilum sp. 51_7]MBZ4652314.1 type toxin-antitoxin system RelE/ParE family toxin [Proteiniphilum sp.]HCC85277.1 addiction module toxin RelE [Porphyromonadaceae bacterium]